MLANLKQSPLAWQVRRTRLYKAWRRFRAPGQALSVEHERAFYRGLLGSLRGGTALDIGANVGSKTEILRGLGARVIAVEPDPDLGALLGRRFAGDPNVIIEPCAVAAQGGTLVLYKFVGAEAYNTVSSAWAEYLQAPNSRFGAAQISPVPIQVPAVTLASLLERTGPVRFIKIDVEGLEWSVLSTLTAPIPYLSLEFNLPLFMPELVRCVEHLEQLDPGYRFNVAITEPPQRFELETWLEAQRFLELLTERAWGYAEIYARTDRAGGTST